MNKSERQNALDVQKWIDSEQKGYDCCGSYDFCSKCDKQVEYPCAVAYDAFNAKAEKKPAKKAAKKPAKKAVQEEEEEEDFGEEAEELQAGTPIEEDFLSW